MTSDSVIRIMQVPLEILLTIMVMLWDCLQMCIQVNKMSRIQCIRLVSTGTFYFVRIIGEISISHVRRNNWSNKIAGKKRYCGRTGLLSNFQWQVMHDLLQLRLNLVWILSVYATQTNRRTVHNHIGETLKSLHRITRPYT